MKTSLAYLLERTRTQLAEVVALMRQIAPAERIIPFGSHARGLKVDDVSTGKKYRLAADELAVVGKRVRELGGVVKGACRENLASLAADGLRGTHRN